MSDLDRVFNALSEISMQLADLPPDAYDDRTRLESEREALRAEAAALRDNIGDERPTGEIVKELESLRARLHDIKDSRIDVVSQQGGSGMESSGASGTLDLNRQIETGQGADNIQARIRQLERTLAGREDTPS